MTTTTEEPIAVLAPVDGTASFFRGAVLLMSATALSALLGLVFWTVAARVLPASEVGRDGSIATALIALSSACQLNLAATLPRFLPGLRERARSVARLALATSAAVAALAAILFEVVAPSFVPDLRVLHSDGALAVVFVVGVVAWSVLAVQDAALAAVRRPGWLPVEQLLFNVLRVGTLAVGAAVGLGHSIVVAWVIPLVIVLPVGSRILFARGLPEHAARPKEGALAATQLRGSLLVRFVTVDSTAFVLRQAAIGALPVMVLGLVGAHRAAAFTVPFALVLAFDLMFLGAATSFTIEGAQHGARLGGLVDGLVRRFLAPMLAIAVLLAIAAPIALLPFGHDYATHGATALRFLVLGSAVRAVLVLIEVLLRLRGYARPNLAAAVIVVVSLALITPPLVHAHGIAGAGAAWLGAHLIALAAVAPIGWRALREARRA